ncbi:MULTISPECIES: radical SAM protein [unclassified Clostridium]|uniref:radical SAM protein n=1 Tax=unclassified Clostridium TaxID=2614128 RepID=UPI00029780BE|nr:MULTISPECIES: radical SAM protein [unclassified Clostridium]EKQ56700.1 MAG: Fe-S oxidoreductase, coproporphyrinogen III oxidase [Clostridium sp. Maddingley MBC34-26]
MNPKTIYEKGLLFHHYSNTAYPLTPSSFMEYRISDENQIPQFLEEELNKFEELSLYIHIPFCKQRCRFCEYAVLENTDDETEDLYVSLLLKEIEMYSKLLKGKKIVGYDIGGGTPSKLSEKNLMTITETLRNSFDFSKETVYSIETTPLIAMQEPKKILAIFNMGYRRISMGIQTISEKLLNELGREGTTGIYEKAVMNIRKAGFTQLNVDLMYGFLHQTDDDFETTLRYAIGLNPEYITLYRNRYKGTKIEAEAGGVSLYKIIRQYRLAFEILNENGYKANYGKNTFSRVDGDYGTSDYLTKRVISGLPYVGIGLGAQSFGYDYLAYNEGAASKQINTYRKKIEAGKLPIQDIYKLPLEESIGKMVSVAFYFGFINFKAFEKRFGIKFCEHFSEEVKFVTENGLMEIKNGGIYLTERGSDYITGVIPLFYSERSKKELIKLSSKTINRSQDEKVFLEAYNIEEYSKPSLTVDCVIFFAEQDKVLNDKNMKVLLIKRGEHPYMNCWAIPGGFVKINETLEETAVRELEEETGLKNVQLSLVHVFSNAKRDPRGWIVSCAYAGLIREEPDFLRYGEDAIDVKWFDVTGLGKMELAFDHAEIIQTALNKIKE